MNQKQNRLISTLKKFRTQTEHSTNNYNWTKTEKIWQSFLQDQTSIRQQGEQPGATHDTRAGRVIHRWHTSGESGRQDTELKQTPEKFKIRWNWTSTQKQNQIRTETKHWHLNPQIITKNHNHPPHQGTSSDVPNHSQAQNTKQADQNSPKWRGIWRRARGQGKCWQVTGQEDWRSTAGSLGCSIASSRNTIGEPMEPRKHKHWSNSASCISVVRISDCCPLGQGMFTAQESSEAQQEHVESVKQQGEVTGVGQAANWAQDPGVDLTTVRNPGVGFGWTTDGEPGAGVGRATNGEPGAGVGQATDGGTRKRRQMGQWWGTRSRSCHWQGKRCGSNHCWGIRSRSWSNHWLRSAGQCWGQELGSKDWSRASERHRGRGGVHVALMRSLIP